MNVFSCVRSFLILLKVFGIFPISQNAFFSKKTRKLAKLLNEIGFYISLILTLFVAILNAEYDFSKDIWAYCIFSGVLCNFVTLVYQRLKWKSIWEFMKTLEKIDGKVSF